MYPDRMSRKNIWCHDITLQVDFALFGLAINAKADSVALDCWGKNTYIPSWAVGWMSFPSSKIQTSYLEAGLLVKILVLSLEFHGIFGVVIVLSQDPVYHWDGKRNTPPTTQAQKMWFTSEHANGSMVAQWKILILNLTTSYIFIVGRHKNPTSGARICQSRACGFSQGLSITLDL